MYRDEVQLITNKSDEVQLITNKSVRKAYGAGVECGEGRGELQLLQVRNRSAVVGRGSGGAFHARAKK